MSPPPVLKFKVLICCNDAKKQTLDYVGFRIRKSQDWTRMKKLIPAHAKAKSIQIFCIGSKMPAGSFGQAKNITWDFVD